MQKTQRGYPHMEQLNFSSFQTRKSDAAFKSRPSVVPGKLLGFHKWPGRCCSCMPHSKNNLFDDCAGIQDYGNLLDLTLPAGKGSLLQRLAPYVYFACHRQATHNYKNVNKQVLQNPKLVEAIEHQAIQNSKGGGGKLSVEQYSKGHLQRATQLVKNMQANVSNYLLKFACWFLLKFLGSFLSSVLVHRGQLKMVEKACKKGVPVLFLPTHRSHLDYILVTLVLFSNNLPAPHIAAGENLRMPIFSFLMRGLGGFFIRRKLDKPGGKDIVYRSMLQSYVEELLVQNELMEIFIEGGRTRTGKAVHPKAGLLSVIVDCLAQGKIEDIYVVPVSISYDCLLEGNFATELMGKPKKTETFWRALMGVWTVFCSHYGSLQINFAQPFSLMESLEALKTANSQHGMPASPELQSPPGQRMITADSFGSFDVSSTSQSDYRHLIQDLGKHIIHSCTHMENLMSTQLLSFLLLYRHRDGAETAHLCASLHWLAMEVTAHGRLLGYTGTDQDVLEYALTLLHQSIQYVVNDDKVVIKPVTTLPGVFHLAYYANPVVTMFACESLFATALWSRIEVAAQEQPYKDVTVTKEEVINATIRLANYLHYEFVVCPPCQTMDTMLEDVCEKLLNADILQVNHGEGDFEQSSEQEKKWAQRFTSSLQMSDNEDSGDEYDIQSSTVYTVKISSKRNTEKLNFLKEIISPLIDTYYMTGMELNMLSSQDILEDQFVNAVHKVILQHIECGACPYSESSSLVIIHNAVQAFERLNIVERYRDESMNKAMLSLAPQYKDPQALAELWRDLETFRH